jgi:hypothetical protein
MTLRMTRTPKSHHVAELGKRRVKHRRGWSSKNANVSFVGDPFGKTLNRTHMINRSRQGNPVFLRMNIRITIPGEVNYPAMMRKAPSNRGNTALWKESIESLVRVYPTMRRTSSRNTQIIEEGCSSETSPPTTTDTRIINNRSKRPVPDNPSSKTNPTKKH